MENCKKCGSQNTESFESHIGIKDNKDIFKAEMHCCDCREQWKIGPYSYELVNRK